MPQLSLGRLVILGLVGSMIATASVVLSVLENPQANIHLSPEGGERTVGEIFPVTVVVKAEVPVNVFKGQVNFDYNIMAVASIDYNTSIADLWAEEPWYENGDGTLNFIGGTTRAGGFSGEDTLITINFRTLKPGRTSVTLSGVRILQHDGLGTDVTVATPIDAVFAVLEEKLEAETIVRNNSKGPTLTVKAELPTTDLNGDGKQTATDLSIFMTHLISQNKRSDFNEDGVVNTKDLSIIISQ